MISDVKDILGYRYKTQGDNEFNCKYPPINHHPNAVVTKVSVVSTKSLIFFY